MSLAGVEDGARMLGRREGTFVGSDQHGNLYNRGYERVLECPPDVLT